MKPLRSRLCYANFYGTKNVYAHPTAHQARSSSRGTAEHTAVRVMVIPLNDITSLVETAYLTGCRTRHERLGRDGKPWDLEMIRQFSSGGLDDLRAGLEAAGFLPKSRKKKGLK